MQNIFFDDRWIGLNGIGRFANEIAKLIPFELRFTYRENPTSIISFFKFTNNLKFSHAKGIYSPGYIPPFGTAIPFVFTIHDLNHIDVSHNSSFLKRFYYQHIILPGVHKAYRIVTVSEFSKQRIVEWSGCSPDKVVVACNGVSDAFTEHGNPAMPGYTYLFCCSNRKGHKNEARLLEAYKLSGLHKQMKLVFTGLPDETSSAFIAKLGLADHVVFTGRIDEPDLAAWYRGAIATVFPSLYEGFGLPVIESMACGTPVITSNSTSLPEVGGNAAYYVDPLSIESIAHGMTTVVNDTTLQHHMRTRGLERVKLFTWERAAQAVKNALEGMLD